MDDSPVPGVSPEAATSAGPDIMNDAEYAPPQRRDTASSAGFGDTCRICRSEGTLDEPLFYPCKCSGSIKFVHQECLMEWLSHSHKKHCELCKTPFRFTKLYDANMPKTLPWNVFVRRACLHVIMTCVRTFRALLVAVVWLVALPWLIRWAWRWMFWFADAGWAREAFIRKMHNQTSQGKMPVNGEHQKAFFNLSDAALALGQLWHNQAQDSHGAPNTGAVNALTATLQSVFSNATSSGHSNATQYWPQSDSSILSSWTYISELTSNTKVNRIILDIFEGQLITCVVITGFILVFLIREWVVQQQPLVNLDNLNHENRERERARLERERLRLREHAELLDQARERLTALQEATASSSTEHIEDDSSTFQGWEALAAQMDHAVNRLRGGDDAAYREFSIAALDVMKQIRSAEHQGNDTSQLADKIFDKLESLTGDERQAWEEVLISELQKIGVQKTKDSRATPFSNEPSQAGGSAARRPPMPDRDISSRATQIQRFLEEADGSLAIDGDSEPKDEPSGETTQETPTESTSVVSASSTDISWQQVSTPDRSSDVQDVPDHIDIFQEHNDEIPITNAGPDAKINIRRSGKGKTRAIIPAPEEPVNSLRNEELKKLLDEDVASSSAALRGDLQDDIIAADEDRNGVHFDDHLHPEGAEPEPQQDTLRGRVASAFREEFGLDEDPGPAVAQEPEFATNTEQPLDDAGVDALPPRQQLPEARPNALQSLADWFWGDIQPQGAPEPAPLPNEELIGEGDDLQEAPFVPVQDLQAFANIPHAQEANDNDPEVLAAAQEAGVDAEAVEDAEDLEGIFELIGLQGPLLGLFQTSCFCSVLVTGTVYGAVGLPYVWGKLVLSFLGSPVTFMIKTPLQLASFVADVVIDTTLVIGGWLVVVSTLLLEAALATIEHWLPSLSKYNFMSWITDVATSTAGAAGSRLQNMLLSDETTAVGDLGWNWAMLGASMHAHASLKDLQEQSNAVLHYVGSTITAIVDTISSGSVSLVWQRSFNAFVRITEIPARIIAGVEALEKYKTMYLDIIGSLRTGALTFQSSTKVLDPHLVYWNTGDRGMAVLTGYIALALIAAVYVALDKPITRSQSGQKTEKMIRDTLRQAGGVLKVILIISIEMLVFPLYCGLLLDLAFLPLFSGASVATRWAFAGSAPNTFCFVHWFVGTCYMFHFALFVGMCRKILRKGVLWFIRDPDDPTFHPVRDVLERNVTTQLRKIAFSALVYGALVILCLGGVIWTIGQIFNGIFPIHWTYTEPVLEFPMDLLLYNFATPVLIRIIKPSQAVHAIYAWWLRRCARLLRLSHFLFGDRHKDEEGRQVRNSWISFILMRKANPEEPVTLTQLDRNDLPEVYFKRDGKYVMTPCNDQYRPPKPGEAFLHSADGDVYITDKDGKKNEHFAKVYIPPFFRLRVTLFMVCLWMFSAFAGLCATLVPLVVGRYIFASILPTGVRVNDIYSYSLGAYILGCGLFGAFKGSSSFQYMRNRAQAVNFQAWMRSAMKRGMQVVKCAYVYGFLGIVLPLIVAFLLQFYFILPIHTYAVASLHPIMEAATNDTARNVINGTDIASNFLQFSGDGQHNAQDYPRVAEHGIHLLADIALAMLYLRIGFHWVITAPASRAAEALRRITADGALNPNAWLATRFFILPATLISTIMLLTPPGLAKLAITIIGFLDLPLVLSDAARTMIYRFSYPLAAGFGFVIMGSVEVAKATARWRARIRDEVYLVGERLHNFGEKRPPVGSRSVVRKDK